MDVQPDLRSTVLRLIRAILLAELNQESVCEAFLPHDKPARMSKHLMRPEQVQQPMDDEAMLMLGTEKPDRTQNVAKSLAKIVIISKPNC